MTKRKKNSPEHKQWLIDSIKYDMRYEDSAFMSNVLKEALFKLKNGMKPTKVEDFIVNVEIAWRKI